MLRSCFLKMCLCVHEENPEIQSSMKESQEEVESIYVSSGSSVTINLEPPENFRQRVTFAEDTKQPVWWTGVTQVRSSVVDSEVVTLTAQAQNDVATAAEVPGLASARSHSVDLGKGSTVPSEPQAIDTFHSDQPPTAEPAQTSLENDEQQVLITGIISKALAEPQQSVPQKELTLPTQVSNAVNPVLKKTEASRQDAEQTVADRVPTGNLASKTMPAIHSNDPKTPQQGNAFEASGHVPLTQEESKVTDQLKQRKIPALQPPKTSAPTDVSATENGEPTKAAREKSQANKPRDSLANKPRDSLTTDPRANKPRHSLGNKSRDSIRSKGGRRRRTDPSADAKQDEQKQTPSPVDDGSSSSSNYDVADMTIPAADEHLNAQERSATPATSSRQAYAVRKPTEEKPSPTPREPSTPPTPKAAAQKGKEQKR
jgi:hypothetical protein